MNKLIFRAGLTIFLSSFLFLSPALAKPAPLTLSFDADDDGLTQANPFFAAQLHISDGRLFDSSFFSPEARANSQRKGGGNPPPPPPSTYPNDPYYWSTGSWGQTYPDLWGIKRIHADQVWSTYKGEGIKIAVVDTGILLNQEDIAANIWTNTAEANGLPGVDDDGDGFVDDVHGWNFVNNNNNPADLNGHGTHVAGIAAAVGNNGKDIIGVAPLAQVIPVRVLNQNGSGTIQSVADGIRYAAKVGANVINLSLGAASLDATSFSILESAVKFAENLGSIIVAAAGNSNSDVDQFSPANIDGVIAVGATDPFDNRASFSNFGNDLWLTAPGVNILSLGTKQTHIGTTISSNDYLASGTSMAAPFVSGAIALLLDKYPGASIDFIKTQLANGAVDLGNAGWDPYYGYGLLNIAASLGIGSTTSTATPASVIDTQSPTSSNTQSAALDEILDKQEVQTTVQNQREEIKTPGAPVLTEDRNTRLLKS